MKKTPYIVIGIAFVLFNLIAFAVPTEMTAAFWTAYVFSIIAFGISAFVWYQTVEKQKELKSKLLGASVAYICSVYLFIQLAAFKIFKFVETAPVWSAVLACAVILGVSAICMITTSAGAGMISATENKVAVKRQCIKNMQIEIEMLAESEADSEIKQKLTALARKIRLSDPMSAPSLSELEEELSAKVSAIGTSSDKLAAINEAEVLLLKRNKQTKSLKG